MERSPDTDRALIDLLYGEGDEASRVAAQAQVESDAALAGELEQMRALRGSLQAWREETEPAPTGGMDELLAAARAQVGTVSRKAERPAAVAAEPPERSLWERISAWMAPLLAHPGMAAATTLVLVVGVAGTLYVTRGPQMAEPTASRVDRAPEETAATAPGAAPEETAATATTGAAPAPAAVTAEPPRAPAVVFDSDSKAARFRDVETKQAPERRPQKRRAATPVDVGGAAGGDSGFLGKSERADKPKAAPKEPVDNSLDERGGMGAAPAASAPAAESAPPPPPAPVRAPAPAPVQASDEAPRKASSRPTEAEQATREAQAAARKGDCDVVRKLSSRVRALDAAYHQRTFLRDRDIAGCLASKK